MKRWKVLFLTTSIGKKVILSTFRLVFLENLVKQYKFSYHVKWREPFIISRLQFVITWMIRKELLTLRLVTILNGETSHTQAPPRFSTYTRKTREPGKTYHASDVASGTDLLEPNQVDSICYVTCMISFTRFPRFIVQRWKAGRSLGTRLTAPSSDMLPRL